MINKIKEMLSIYFNHQDVLAVLLLGSVSAEANDSISDVDFTVILRMGSKEPELILPEAPWDWDAAFIAEEELMNMNSGDWQINAFLTAKILIDKTSWISNKINELISIPAKKRHQHTANTLDAYLNGFYRSMKAMRRGQELGALLEGADSIRYFYGMLYSLNGYITPYQDRIEVTFNLLQELPLPKERLLELTSGILRSADPKLQSELFRVLEKMMRGKGYGEIYDAWEGKLEKELL